MVRRLLPKLPRVTLLLHLPKLLLLPKPLPLRKLLLLLTLLLLLMLLLLPMLLLPLMLLLPMHLLLTLLHLPMHLPTNNSVRYHSAIKKSPDVCPGIFFRLNTNLNTIVVERVSIEGEY